ncbi:MAG: ankyrin repeat domain-containing protein [Archangium sp.]|nr:ankyrin repeat domain-containing protein [Archangium sp.]
MTLFEAAECGDLSLLKAALKSAPDVNAIGDEKKTPLILAAARGWVDGVKLLLAAGAEHAWRDASDETALLKAAANGHLEAARVLAPMASEDDKALANSFLKAFGASHAPEFSYDDGRLGGAGAGETASGLKKKAVQVVARAANFIGDEDPLQRVERQQRAEDNAKKSGKR